MRLQFGDPNNVAGTGPDMKTPNIDELITRSAWFPRAQVQQAICGASRTSFMTGRR